MKRPTRVLITTLSLWAFGCRSKEGAIAADAGAVSLVRDETKSSASAKDAGPSKAAGDRTAEGLHLSLAAVSKDSIGLDAIGTTILVQAKGGPYEPFEEDPRGFRTLRGKAPRSDATHFLGTGLDDLWLLYESISEGEREHTYYDFEHASHGQWQPVKLRDGFSDIPGDWFQGAAATSPGHITAIAWGPGSIEDAGSGNRIYDITPQGEKVRVSAFVRGDVSLIVGTPSGNVYTRGSAPDDDAGVSHWVCMHPDGKEELLAEPVLRVPTENTSYEADGLAYSAAGAAGFAVAYQGKKDGREKMFLAIWHGKKSWEVEPCPFSEKIEHLDATHDDELWLTTNDKLWRRRRGPVWDSVDIALRDFKSSVAIREPEVGGIAATGAGNAWITVHEKGVAGPAALLTTKPTSEVATFPLKRAKKR